MERVYYTTNSLSAHVIKMNQIRLNSFQELSCEFLITNLLLKAKAVKEKHRGKDADPEEKLRE